MPRFGLVNSLAYEGPFKAFLRYVTDGLKLYMPYKDKGGEVQFVGTGSTSFDGTNDYVSLSSQALASTFTISMWIKPDDITSVNLLGLSSASTDFLWIDGSNDVVLGSGDLSLSFTSSNITVDVWQHIAITRDSSNIPKFYKDGVLVQTLSADAGTFTFNQIGRFHDGDTGSAEDYFYNGLMKNVAIWNRALTATEVQNVMYKSYAEVSGRLASGLVSWWAMDATSLGSNLVSSSFQNNTNGWGGYDTFETATAAGFHVIETNLGAGYASTADEIVFKGSPAAYVVAFDAKLTSGVAPNVYVANGYAGASIGTPSSQAVRDGSNTVTFTNISAQTGVVEFNSTGNTEYTISNFSCKEVNIEDLKGSNDGEIVGATVDTDLYGSDTPVKPRAVDNSPKVQADEIGSGSALFVTGNDDYIDVGAGTNLIPKGDFTVNAWIKKNGTAYGWIFQGGTSTQGWKLDVGSSSDGGNALRGRVFYSGGSNAEVVGDTSVADVGWRFVSMVIEAGTSMKLYVDGVLDKTNTSSIPAASLWDTPVGGNLIGIYADRATYGFDGNICQASFYQGALSQEKIQAVMEKTFEELDATEKSSLGAELWDEDARTGTVVDNWGVSGTNTVAVDDNTIKITYVDNSDGATIALRNTADLSTDLTVGQLYKLSLDAKINTGTATTYISGPNITTNTISGNTFQTYDSYFVATSATSNSLMIQNLGSGEIVHVDNLSLKEVTHDLVSYWALDETIESSGTGASFVYDKMDTTLGSNTVPTANSTPSSGHQFVQKNSSLETVSVSDGELTLTVPSGNDAGMMLSNLGSLGVDSSNYSVGDIVKFSFDAKYVTNGSGYGNTLRYYTNPLYLFESTDLTLTTEYQTFTNYHVIVSLEYAIPYFYRNANRTGTDVYKFKNFQAKKVNGNTGQLI